jgi:hypothetical protein
MAYEEIAHRPWRHCRATQDASWVPKYTAGMYSLGGIGERVAEECAQISKGEQVTQLDPTRFPDSSVACSELGGDG